LSVYGKQFKSRETAIIARIAELRALMKEKLGTQIIQIINRLSFKVLDRDS
jgi:hypothetical protein